MVGSTSNYAVIWNYILYYLHVPSLRFTLSFQQIKWSDTTFSNQSSWPWSQMLLQVVYKCLPLSVTSPQSGVNRTLFQNHATHALCLSLYTHLYQSRMVPSQLGYGLQEPIIKTHFMKLKRITVSCHYPPRTPVSPCGGSALIRVLSAPII